MSISQPLNSADPALIENMDQARAELAAASGVPAGALDPALGHAIAALTAMPVERHPFTLRAQVAASRWWGGVLQGHPWLHRLNLNGPVAALHPDAVVNSWGQFRRARRFRRYEAERLERLAQATQAAVAALATPTPEAAAELARLGVQLSAAEHEAAIAAVQEIEAAEAAGTLTRESLDAILEKNRANPWPGVRTGAQPVDAQTAKEAEAAHVAKRQAEVFVAPTGTPAGDPGWVKLGQVENVQARVVEGAGGGSFHTVTNDPLALVYDRSTLTGNQARAFTPAEQDAIHEAARQGWALADIARRVGVHRSTISRIVNGVTYTGGQA